MIIYKYKEKNVYNQIYLITFCDCYSQYVNSVN